MAKTETYTFTVTCKLKKTDGPAEDPEYLANELVGMIEESVDGESVFGGDGGEYEVDASVSLTGGPHL